MTWTVQNLHKRMLQPFFSWFCIMTFMEVHNNKAVSVSHSALKWCHRPLTHQCPNVHRICNLITDWNPAHFMVTHYSDWTRCCLEIHFCLITLAPGIKWQKQHWLLLVTWASGWVANEDDLNSSFFSSVVLPSMQISPESRSQLEIR